MFLANENFPYPSTILLRNAGYIVDSIREEFPGIPDDQVLVMAIERNLIILTFDKDYGEIIFRHHLQNPPAVIFFREKGINPFFAGQTLLGLFKLGEMKFENAFTVIEKNNIRQRFY